ncbi:hypothetical protein LC653_12940 [Nostoc sp. CHAB 5784]|uniref:hypothetical protein n=1 Tax=Nostoc mirabile TaxID=2907820 RepID=UPI001E4D0EEF|nr:hypothetical protein [Nostoc mirabile]MCC5664798.1 hypothetical protein [Nostoc mirabile CHAB5784]
MYRFKNFHFLFRKAIALKVALEPSHRNLCKIGIAVPFGTVRGVEYTKARAIGQIQKLI